MKKVKDWDINLVTEISEVEGWLVLCFFFNMKRIRQTCCVMEGIQGEKQKFLKSQNMDRHGKELIGTGSRTTKQKLKSVSVNRKEA